SVFKSASITTSNRGSSVTLVLRTRFAPSAPLIRLGDGHQKREMACHLPSTSHRLCAASLCRFELGRSHGHEDTPLRLGAEFHVPLGHREQRVVGAHADVVAGMSLRAALAHDDVAPHDELAAVLLHAEALRMRIAAVPRRPACLFVCHVSNLVVGSAALQAPMMLVIRTFVKS